MKEKEVMLKRFNVLLFGLLVLVSLLIAGFGARYAFAELALVPCDPVEIATFYNPGGPVSRVHVKCKSAVDGISYFAVSTVDAANADMILRILTTAYTDGGGKTLSILYDPDDLSGASFGCLISNCRPIGGVLLSDKNPHSNKK